MKKTAPQEQGAAESGVKCWKGEPGAVGVIDPNYQFKTEPLSSEDLAELLGEMQGSMRQVLLPGIADEYFPIREQQPRSRDVL